MLKFVLLHNKEKNARCYFLLIFLILATSSKTQNLFPIQNFTPISYNGDTQNWHICQSDDKVIYIANNKGLLEYNGANWKLYHSPNQTIMRSVYVKDKRIYTGCYMEFGYWERDEYSNLRYTSLSAKIKNKLQEDEHFWNIVSYQQWVLFQSLHRIYIYDLQRNKFKIINSATNLPKIFVLDNQIYYQKINEGIFKLENGTSILLTASPILKNNIIINITSLGSKLLIQTQEKGFFVFDNGNVSPWQAVSSAVINSLSIYSSLQLHDGSFVLGTVGDGAYILSPDGRISMHIGKKNGLQNNTVLALFEDADHNVWFGLDNGISVLNYDSPYRFFYDTEGIFGTVYTSSYYQGNLYLGTNQGLYYKPINSDENFKLVNGTKGQVWMLKVIENTLFCGHNAGTFIVSGNQAQAICSEMGTWEIKQVPDNPNLLIQGNYEGLNVLEKQNGVWRFRNKIKGFKISSRFFEIMPHNQVFVSHEYKGVYKLELSNDYKSVVKITNEPSALKSFNAALAKFDQQLFYFAEQGAFVYNQATRKFEKDEKMTQSVLGSDGYISGKIVQDDNRTYWLFTKENVIALSSGKINNELNIHKIALPLSMRENVVGYENILHLGNNTYLLGTTNGYIILNLNKITDKDYAIQISLAEKNRVNKASITLPLTAKMAHLKRNENNVRFCFSVSVFDKFTPVKYQYKLEDIYSEWSEWTNQPEVTFKNLPSGKYTFQVRAMVGNKLTSNIATFKFSIAKPWYASLWMMLVYFILFLWLLVIINRVYRNRYDKKMDKIYQEKLLMQLQNEKEIIKLKNDNLNSEVESINRELTASTMAVVQKNELLNAIRLKLQQGADNVNVKSALKIIDENLDKNSDWESFQDAFNNTDRDFLKKLKELHPSLTPNDLKLCVYLRLNLSSKEIAPMLNISPQSVEIKRFRLRKKMELNHEANLTDYILGI